MNVPHVPQHDRVRLSLGEGIYTAEGNRVGTIRGFDDSGFYVSMRADVDAPVPSAHSTAGGAGEIDLMWRCWQCGETGRIDDIPDGCPSCGAGGEELYYWTED